MREDFLYLKSYPELPLNIDLAGISYCDGTYHITRSCSTVTVIEYVVQGEGYIIQNGNKTTVGADRIYILKAGEPHDYYSSAKNPWKKIFINFSGDFSLTLLEKYNLLNKTVFDGKGLKYIFERIEKAVQVNDKSPTCHAMLCASFYEILANLAIEEKYLPEHSEAVMLKKYLDTNTHRIVKNSELSSVIYRSEDYIIKLFAKQYGITPYEYQINEKMAIARRLLKNTFLSIAEIGSSIGYSDAHYFSGLFKNRHGMSPKEYRKS